MTKELVAVRCKCGHPFRQVGKLKVCDHCDQPCHIVNCDYCATIFPDGVPTTSATNPNTTEGA